MRRWWWTTRPNAVNHAAFVDLDKQSVFVRSACGRTLMDGPVTVRPKGARCRKCEQKKVLS